MSRNMDNNNLITKKASKKGTPIGHVVDVPQASTLPNVWKADQGSQATKKRKNNRNNPTPAEAAADSNSRNSSYGSSSRDSRLSSIESRLTKFDDFVDKMEQHDIAQKEQTEAMQNMVLQSREAQKEATNRHHEETDRHQKHFEQIMAEQQKERVSMREQMQQTEKRHQEQMESEKQAREQATLQHRQDKEAAMARQRDWEDKFAQLMMKSNSKRDHDIEEDEEEQRKKTQRQGGTPVRIGAAKARSALEAADRAAAEKAPDVDMTQAGGTATETPIHKVQIQKNSRKQPSLPSERPSRSSASNTGLRATPQAELPEEGADPSESSGGT